MSETPAFIRPQAQTADITIPRFYIKPVQNNFKSDQEGRPIFEDLEYVEIAIPGDMRSVVDRLVKDEDKRRWPQYYDAFKRDIDYLGEGLPLSEWGAITRSQVEEFKHFRIKTVEQLANLPDEHLGAIGLGGRGLRDQAKVYLETMATGAPTARLIAEGVSKDATIQALKDQVAEMQEQLTKLSRKDAADGST